MYKYPITYTNYNGETVVDTLYFNIKPFEMMKLETSTPGGWHVKFQKTIEAQDFQSVLAMFEEFVGLAYGIKSDDGSTFVKSKEISEKFFQSAAYDQFLTELFSKENALADFYLKLIPDVSAFEQKK